MLAESQPYFFSGESSRRGKAGAAWGWPPHGAPPSNPRRQPRWLSHLLGPRSGPVSFWEKLTRATSRSAIAITLILRAGLALRGGLQRIMFPGEVLRQHGTSGKVGSWRRAAVARQADRLSKGLLLRGRCAGGSKGESSASAGDFSKLFPRTRIARHSVTSQPSSFRRTAGRLEESGTRHGGFP